MGRVSMPQGKGSQMHNRREYEKYGKPTPDNIDVSKSHENITLVDKDIKEAYREIFGEALDKYNAKQKRADRKIEDYCDHIKKSKNGEKLFYEDVVQWGSKDDFQNPQTRERAKEALVKYVEGFEERNPNLKLIGAYIHMDEASPHLHLDYVPVANGYSRGLETRNSLDKAMKQMGFQPRERESKEQCHEALEESERAVFGEICRGLGLEVEPERKSDRKSLTVEEYKDARDEMLGDIEQEKKAIVAEVEPLRELKTGIDEIAGTGKTILPGVVAVKKKDLEAVKEQAKAYTANRDEIGELRQRSAAVSQREQRADQREQQLDNKANELAMQQQQLQQMYQRQLNLNQLLEKSEQNGRAKDKQIADLQENGSLMGQIRSLTAQLDEVKAELWNKINDLTDKLKGAYEPYECR